MWLIMVGTVIRMVGRYRAIRLKTTSAVQRSSNSTPAAPAANGNSRLAPMA